MHSFALSESFSHSSNGMINRLLNVVLSSNSSINYFSQNKSKHSKRPSKKHPKC